MGMSAGGCFLPGDPPPSTGQVLNQPVCNWQVMSMTATGATGTDAAQITAGAPCLIVATGTSGAGIAFPTGAVVAGAWYLVKNATTGVLKVYSVGATINGTTGTTAISISATGTLTAGFGCVAAGAWQVMPAAT